VIAVEHTVQTMTVVWATLATLGIAYVGQRIVGWLHRPRHMKDGHR
jgi:hypothetical protein